MLSASSNEHFQSFDRERERGERTSPSDGTALPVPRGGKGIVSKKATSNGCWKIPQ